MKRRSIEPTYDSRETGPRFHVTTRLGDYTTEFQKPIDDPFVRHTTTVAWRDILRCAISRQRVRVTVLVGADRDLIDDVMELDANTLTPNSTRRDEFNVSLGASLRTVVAGSEQGTGDQ